MKKKNVVSKIACHLHRARLFLFIRWREYIYIYVYCFTLSTHTKYEALEICIDCSHLLLLPLPYKYHYIKYKSESKCIRTEGFFDKVYEFRQYITVMLLTFQIPKLIISIIPHEFDEDYYALLWITNHSIVQDFI